jgi:hypothetical protein
LNKFFKTGCLVIVILGVIGIVGVAIERWHDAPTQSIAFLNTANVTRSVTFERIAADGKLASTYTIENDIKPNQMVIEKVPEGNYKVKVWNQDESLYKSTDFKVTLKGSKKSNFQLYRFDLAMDKVYAIVNLNALYEGNSIAKHMSNAVGTNRGKLQIEKLYDGGIPFFVQETYTLRTFVDTDDKIPTKVKYGEVVYGLFSFPKELPEDQMESVLFEQISKKMK